MANETTLVNGVTKREKDNILIYYFPTALITADVVQETYTVKQLQAPETQLTVAFADITQKFGTTNVEQYCDLLATLEFYFELPPSEQLTIWGNIQGNLSDQTDLQIELDDKQELSPQGVSVAQDGGWATAEIVLSDPIWVYDSNTTITNPAIGTVRLNNTNLGLVTQAAISATTKQGVPANELLNLITEGSVLDLRQFGDFSKYLIGVVSNITDNGTWYQADIQVIDSSVYDSDGVDTVLKAVRINPFVDQTITGTGTELDPYSVSVPSAYTEIYASGNLSQNLPNAGAVLQFNANGLSKNITPNQGGDEILVVQDGDYEVIANIAFNLEKETTYDLFVRVNGSNVRMIGESRSKEEDDTTVYIGGGAILNLSAGDSVQLYVDPTGNNKAFDMRIGSRLTVKRLN